jgi:hypothetical protein
LIAPGLKRHAGTPTPSGDPAAQATVKTCLAGRHEPGVKIIYVTGGPNDPANKGYRICYSVAGQGETPPANRYDLRKSCFTKRKKAYRGRWFPRLFRRVAVDIKAGIWPVWCRPSG